MPWNPFVSKPAPPAGRVSHYHVFLIGEGGGRGKEREGERKGRRNLIENYVNSSNIHKP